MTSPYQTEANEKYKTLCALWADCSFKKTHLEKRMAEIEREIDRLDSSLSLLNAAAPASEPVAAPAVQCEAV
jgi:hypothetical protein